MAVVTKNNNNNKNSIIKRGFGRISAFSAVFLLAFILVFSANLHPAWAIDVSGVMKNIVKSSENVPGLISALAYLIALVLCISGIFKLIDYVQNPQQTGLRVPLVRFAVGGALFALPIIYEATLTSINGGSLASFSYLQGAAGIFIRLMGGLMNIPGAHFVTSDFNAILAQMINSIEDTPGFISAGAYILGLIAGVSGLLKLKEHVEEPERNPLKEGVVRLAVAGLLFGLPTLYSAMDSAIGDTGVLGTITALLGTLNFFRSSYVGGGVLSGFCNPLAAISTHASVGDALCGVMLHAGAFPAFLTAIAYVNGLIFGVWGIFKIKAHVMNPAQVALSEGLTRFLAGGAFFSLPVIIEVARNTLTPITLSVLGSTRVVTHYRESGLSECDSGAINGGLDMAMGCMMNDVMGPAHVVLNGFAFCAGIIFLMIGISRLIKTAQDGPKGPGGLGTFGTFVCAGALISYNELIRAFTSTLSLGLYGALPLTRTYATIAYAGGISSTDMMPIYTVISAVLKFMIIVGLFSFVRGIFILRSLAEGNGGQGALMSGVTHMIGGAMAINLGPVIQLLQTSLGISAYGIAFT